jgi:ATPase subunit of ABC transporter with duplicated ATPase domains
VDQYSIEGLEPFGDQTVVEYAEITLMKGKASSTIIQNASGNVRQYLGAFGLGGVHAHRPIASLSGGERMRLCFATILAEQPHLLVLDESTNHLDLETLDALSSALDSYQGSVVIVSHNQSFLSGFCKDLWVVDRKTVEIRYSDTETFDEMFSEYRNEALSGVEERATNRQTKASLLKKATRQRAGMQQGTGLIP